MRFANPTGYSRIKWVMFAMTATNLVSVAVIDHAEAHERSRYAFLVAQRAAAKRAADAVTIDSRDSLNVSLRLEEQQSGKRLAGLIRVTDLTTNQPIRLKDRIHRDHHWYVWAADESVIELPRRRLRVEAFHGIDTLVATRDLDLRSEASPPVTLSLRRFSNPLDTQWPQQRSTPGNTHLHLMRLTHAEAVRYLEEVPAADGLDVVFLSILRRVEAERHYISNDFTAADLQRFSQEGAVFANGEEHRHNFGGGGEGFGHVMLLNLQQWVRPISIGPGIMGAGTDSQPLQQGILQARRQGATVVWCHNAFGYEDLPNWAGGLIDAQNIFDGGSQGSYEQTFYRYLNLGWKVPFSTGTDWFIYDFSRVYVPLATSVKRTDLAVAWLDGLRQGKATITNGPLLSLHVDQQAPGSELLIDNPQTIPVHVQCTGRSNFGTVQLIHNGKVIKEATASEVDGHFQLDETWDVAVDEPGWLAARVAPATAATPLMNELQQPLFAHTSAVYLRYQNRRRFETEVAQELIQEMQQSRDKIREQATFGDAQQRKSVLNVYDRGIHELEEQIERANESP